MVQSCLGPHNSGHKASDESQKEATLVQKVSTSMAVDRGDKVENVLNKFPLLKAACICEFPNNTLCSGQTPCIKGPLTLYLLRNQLTESLGRSRFKRLVK